MGQARRLVRGGHARFTHACTCTATYPTPQARSLCGAAIAGSALRQGRGEGLSEGMAEGEEGAGGHLSEALAASLSAAVESELACALEQLSHSLEQGASYSCVLCQVAFSILRRATTPL